MEVKIYAEPIEKEENEEKEPTDWEIDSAVDAICRAEEIKANPKLWPLVKEKLIKKGTYVEKAIRSLGDLKKAYKTSLSKESES